MDEKKFSAVRCPECRAEVLADKTVAKWYCGYCGKSFPLSGTAEKTATRKVKVVAVRPAKSKSPHNQEEPSQAPKKEELKAEAPKPAQQPAPAPKKEEPKAQAPKPAQQPAPAPKKEEPKAQAPKPVQQPAPAPKKEEPKAEAAKPETAPAPVQKVSKEASPEDFEILHGVLEKFTGNAENVVIPEDVECIAPAAFKDNKTIRSVVIPDAVYDIGDSAFDGCSALESVKLPLQLSKVGYKTFNGCDSLTSITIPRGVKEIVYNALTCGLREITFENSKTTWEPENEYAMPSFEVDRKGKGDGVRTIYFNNISFPASDIYRFKSVAAFLRTQGLCVYCGGKFGMFSKCKNCGRKKDY